MAHILIAGGSGLIGRRLTELLIQSGHTVSWLSRKSGQQNGVISFAWNPAKCTYDPLAFRNADAVISLAGSSVAAKAWTASYKQEIIESRTTAAATLLHALQHTSNNVKCLVAASAIGFYGDNSYNVLTEESPAGHDFLSETTRQWEAAYQSPHIRTVLIRIGIVLSPNGGALPTMAKPLRFGICPILGNGQQYMSWIHIDDLCGIFLFALEHEQLSGIYNGVAPVPEKHYRFMKTLRKLIAPYAIPMNVPSFALRMLMGERSAIILDSARVSPSKIMLAGYSFRYTDLSQTLIHLYGK